MAFSKIVFNGTVLMDLTNDTVEAGKLLLNYTATGADGLPIVGTYEGGGGDAGFQIDQKTLTVSFDPSGSEMVTPYEEDFIPGYVDNVGKCWFPQDTTNNRSDFYHLNQNELYCLCLGGTVGSRFRAVALSVDPSTATSKKYGTIVCDVSNPSTYAYVLFYSSDKTYLAVTKDNASVDGLKTYLVKTGLNVELE